jgi:hypothetical protein
MFDSFGNKVRIKATLATREKGLAGKIGEVRGQTTPSMKDFEIVGTPKEDFAVHVYFDDLEMGYWFDSDLLETIDDGAGTVITLDGVNKKWTKANSGEWIEKDTTPMPSHPKTNPSSVSIRPHKWWEFWK